MTSTKSAGFSSENSNVTSFAFNQTQFNPIALFLNFSVTAGNVSILLLGKNITENMLGSVIMFSLPFSFVVIG